MLYQKEAQGDWGQMRGTDTIKVATETLAMADGCKLFLRSWVTDSRDILFILHGLGAHSGWFIDMGNALAERGLTVYAGDHRGFGHSEGLPAHIDKYASFVEDCHTIVSEIRRRHPGARLYVLGHSMGAIFTTHLAAKFGQSLAGVLYLNPWVEDSTHITFGTLLSILAGGLFKSKRYWQVTGGTDVMTSNPEAIEMLNADLYWRRKQTSSFLFQILLMRMAVLKLAKQITLPALVMQAGQDKSVLSSGTRKLYDALASADKTWKGYPEYAHDSELEQDRSQMDNDIVDWISKHAGP
ncbi:MAG TPA: lysophospholipase [Ktedonobacteraceae bacterium]|nr:lysophospholipase [Ktedonobacteraceae bacterium]